MAPAKPLCPSSTCEDGAILIGIVREDGRVGFVGGRLKVDSNFVNAARDGASPEARFRFGGACIKGACKQWSGSRCGVIDAVLDAASPVQASEEVPQCSIRPECRWFLQAGYDACRVCPEVITDQRRRNEIQSPVETDETITAGMHVS